ncbi:MAG: hypothetical protein P8185_11985 [Deltaproteobacteria bacterium]|jgi:hypothetical protein
MVDDINFPQGLPPVPASGRVQRVNRKKREEGKKPFDKFLNEEEQEDKKKKKRKKESDTVDILTKANKRGAQNFSVSSNPTDAAEAQDDADKKVIDVRV